MEIKVYACSCAGKFIPEIASLVNGGTKPSAVTVGSLQFYFEKPDDKIRRHENKHVEQYANFAPFWAKPMPLSWRAWLGSLRFIQAYVDENDKVGYARNKFEVEARRAEEV